MKQLKALEILKGMCNVDDRTEILKETIAELEALDNRSCENCKYGDFFDITDDIDDDVYVCEIFKAGCMNIFDVVKPNEFDCRKWEAR